MRCSFTPSAFSSFVFAFFTTSAAAASADPQAVSVDFGPDFFGYDGAWSAAQIRVGSPEQYLLVFPSTISSETWVAGPSFCDGTSTCATLRGGLFYKENSTTWQEVGEYELGYSALSQTVDNGDYGFDNLSISDTISAANQIFAIVDDIDHWIGDLGLGVQETRFQNTTNHLAFISTLVQNNSVIPSHSYGYTAGASYQGHGVLGSLTLGGVDTSRYTSNNIWFELASGYVPSVFLRSVNVAASSKPAGWATNPITLMSQQDSAAFTIDSSTPYLWMPENVCENIANALNLTWNPSIELYTFSNTTSADDLANLDLHFTFQFANNATSAEQAALVLSFGAFNLQLSYPFPGLFTSYSDAKVNYFPLRRANSSQQYTIGRAFLQETYLIVDYERNVFQLSPALFPSSSQQPTLASIKRPDGSTWPGPAGKTPSTGLSTGAKAGIAAGIAVAAIAIAALLWCFCRRRRTAESQEDAKSQRAGLLSVFSKRSTRRSSYSTSAAELQADKRHPTEMNSDSSNSRYELSAIAPVEMAAADVPPTYFQERNNAAISQRNDPRSPVELVQPPPSRSSISKDDAPVNQNRARAESAAPEYSPTDTQTQKSNSISPFSQTHRSNPFRASGSENAISPVTGTNSDRDRLSHGHHARNGSGSDRILSPVSHTSTQSSSLGQGTAATRSPHLSIPGPMPQRSASRDSRFREDLHGGQTQPPAGPANAPPTTEDRKDASRSRFSWED